jgi:tetratricopeptide (TPR) repeat protein
MLMRRMMAVMLLGLSSLSTARGQNPLFNQNSEALRQQFLANPMKFVYSNTDQPTPEATMTAGGPATVSVNELKIPDKAVKELQKSDKALKGGDVRASAEHLEKALTIYPELPAAHNELGSRYAALKEYSKAVDEFEKALALKQNYRLAADNITAVLCLQHRWTDAEPTARHALQIEPEAPSSQYLLGSILVQQGRYTPEATGLLEKVKTKYSRARLFLAVAEAGQGENEQASGELKEYLKLDSAEPEYKKVAQTWLETLSKREEAAKSTKATRAEKID